MMRVCLPFIQFKYKSDNNSAWGFIAEEAATASAAFATWGPDWEYDNSGSLIRNETSGSQELSPAEKYKIQSDNIVPQSINNRAVIAALVKKVQDLETRITQLENA